MGQEFSFLTSTSGNEYACAFQFKNSAKGYKTLSSKGKSGMREELIESIASLRLSWKMINKIALKLFCCAFVFHQHDQAQMLNILN